MVTFYQVIKDLQKNIKTEWAAHIRREIEKLKE